MSKKKLPKEPLERMEHRMGCKHYSYGNCYKRSGYYGPHLHITMGCTPEGQEGGREMKYIDADKLKAEIDRREYNVFPTGDGKVRACSTPDQVQSGWLNALKWVRETITTLQQEQPEVELEKEITPSLVENMLCEFGVQSIEDVDSECLADIARHFYELGLNARKEEMK